ncbi:GerAB/ArcD/ProY family transporter [Paenibacillus mucilaginosus]|uniref:Spore germination protein n=1 Tax=Paenibacillus mucilaginosus 3016 TaxID=1116391 RepID=H6NNT3_9BACL|nr:endospore germination permease [Paenibacillus mucilaginosus]AFC30459.1 spore germination protein [Paenibacillus mucilaginosus 3016]MCG7217524.1 spore germination protein [Paenibacillus mucilaginosus]WDM30921.1 endospore germination permease [Paenibacillus mucilaginosus]WFA19091.1 spore gernimation protein [Paenibacillus mucilaginosus]
MEYPRQITVIQATSVLISTIVGVGVLPLPLFAVRAADTGAPLVTLLGILLAFTGLWTVTKLGMRFPNQSIIGYSEHVLGRWPAWIGSALIIGFFAVLTSLAAREFGEVVITSVLRKTPLEVTVIVMLLLATLSARNNLTTFVYIHQFYLPLILFPGILIVALSLKNAEETNLLPLLGNEPVGMLPGIVTVAALLQGSFVHTIIIPAMRRPEKAMKASLWGMGIAGGLYLSIVTAAVAVFGPEETKLLLWPTLELAKTTTLPGNILERLDAAFLAVWVTAVFTTLFSSYYLTIRAVSRLLRLRDHKMFSFFMLPFLFILAMLPDNIIHMYRIVEDVGRIGLGVTILYPMLLLLVARIRGKRGETHESGPSKSAK